LKRDLSGRRASAEHSGKITDTNMENDTFHLWYAYPDDLLQAGAAEACLLLLSEDELARWERFKFDRHRREYLATHALARIGLSYYSALRPEAWLFQMNSYGKPSVDPESELKFNLSNSPSLVVCLIGAGTEVGVDLEPRERSASIAEVGPRMFSPRELEQLESLREDERPERCLQLWTLKEAYIKARGMGLAMPLNNFSFLFGGSPGIRLALDPSLGDEPGRWRFCLLEHAAHCIALMVESRTSPALQVWDVRLPSMTPRSLTEVSQQWFPHS
jgi:4'-phosphopantetheinyl transferase